MLVSVEPIVTAASNFQCPAPLVSFVKFLVVPQRKEAALLEDQQMPAETAKQVQKGKDSGSFPPFGWSSDGKESDSVNFPTRRL